MKSSWLFIVIALSPALLSACSDHGDAVRYTDALDALVQDSPGAQAHSVNHLLCTGQSLSLGAGGKPALSTTQPYNNRMFNTGVTFTGGTNLIAFKPLVESNQESMSSGLANLVTMLARDHILKGKPAPNDTHDLLVSCNGMGGAYAKLKKGTVPYANAMAQVRAGIKLSHSLGLNYKVQGITVVHGESDIGGNNKAYYQDLLSWQADYEKEIQALTAQTKPIPMFHTQVSSWTHYNKVKSDIPLNQLHAALARPDRIIMVGPKYFLPYVDGLHLTNLGYRWMGEYYAKAYRTVVLEGKPWKPLMPQTVTISGAEITIKFHVPVPPLKLDTTTVTDPGNFGFQYSDDSSAPATIAKVSLKSSTEVLITLDQSPTGNKRYLSYALEGQPKNWAGPKTGARGNLRDSDSTPSRHGNKLHNWAVHFEVPVP